MERLQRNKRVEEARAASNRIQLSNDVRISNGDSMNNQVSHFVKTAEQLELSLQSALNRIHTHTQTRQAFIKHGNRCIKKTVQYSDSAIYKRANELGLKVLSITNRSVTLAADSIPCYYEAGGF